MRKSDSEETESVMGFEPAKHISNHHHMAIPWQDFFTNDNFTPAGEANLVERAAIEYYCPGIKDDMFSRYWVSFTRIYLHGCAP